MSGLTEHKIILIVRKTRLDELISRFNTLSQARFYLEHLGADFSSYQQEDKIYKEAVALTQKTLAHFGRVQIVDRSFIPNFVFGKTDTVVVIGQDGLVANVLKYLDQQPVIGVNPDPERLEGVLLPFTVLDLSGLIPKIFRADYRVNKITIAKAQLTNGYVLYGVNDFFIGAKTHTSAQYQLQVGQQMETQSSSGIIVSTGLGSTGWLKSILAGAVGISSSVSGQAVAVPEQTMPWDADYLYFSVREPWPSKKSSANITFGKVTNQQPLQIYSQMPENGVIFSDGIESDFVEFQAGTQATISIADKQGHLVGKY
jgi:NAD kinase